MKIVFFGTPYYVLPIVDLLHKELRTDANETPIEAVVTQPPKPAGREKILEYSPVDEWAHKRNVPKFFTPADIITNNIKADVGILASYGEMIPQEVISYFPHGILVVHPSLLPEFRWASPVPAAIVTGTNPTGVSIFRMDSKWDHGPIVTTFKEDVLENDNYQTLRDRSFERSARVIADMLPAYIQGKIKLKPQDDSKASFARIIRKEDAFIPFDYLKAALEGKESEEDWEINFIKYADRPFVTKPSALSVDRFIRAMDPWPMAWTRVKIKDQEYRLKLLKTRLKDNKLIIEDVQLEGKNPVSWKQFREGYNIDL